MTKWPISNEESNLPEPVPNGPLGQSDPLPNMTTTTKRKKTPTLFGRYEQVAGILLKYGFEDIASQAPLNRIVPKFKRLFPMRDGRSVLSFSRYERVRMACEELGTTFIKFAQIASNRPDILPEELIEQLTDFQDQILPVPAEEIREILEEEMPL